MLVWLNGVGSIIEDQVFTDGLRLLQLDSIQSKY